MKLTPRELIETPPKFKNVWITRKKERSDIYNNSMKILAKETPVNHETGSQTGHDMVPANTTNAPTPGELYFNRELSFLAFNERVLAQANDQKWPLLERLKFLGISSTNLDEFFETRVSLLRKQRAAGVLSIEPDQRSPSEVLRQ